MKKYINDYLIFEADDELQTAISLLYPDPLLEPERCGREEPGFMCDPERVLTPSGNNH